MHSAIPVQLLEDIIPTLRGSSGSAFSGIEVSVFDRDRPVPLQKYTDQGIVRHMC
jgi:hypothetical protein